MALDFRDIGLDISSDAALESQEAMQSTGEQFKQNALTQKVNNTGTTEEISTSSLQFNPATVEQVEKEVIMELMTVRGKSAVAYVTNGVLLKGMIPHLTTLAGKVPLNAAAGIATKVLSLTARINGLKAELSSASFLLKDLMAAGWKLSRYAESFGIACKAMFVKSETLIYNEAPTIVNQAGGSITNIADLVTNTSNLTVNQGIDEINKLAGIYDIDADFLLALVKTAAVIKSAGDVEIGANGTIKLASIGDIELNSGGKIKLKSTSGIEVESTGSVEVKAGSTMKLNAGASISAQTNALTLHGVASASLMSTGQASVIGAVGAMPIGMAPVPPLDASYAVPPVVIPPVTISPPTLPSTDNELRGAETIPQAQGMLVANGPIT